VNVMSLRIEKSKRGPVWDLFTQHGSWLGRVTFELTLMSTGGPLTDAERASLARAASEALGSVVQPDAWCIAKALDDADRVAAITEALDLVESPGTHPIGAPGSVMRRAQEIGQRLARARIEVDAAYRAGQVRMQKRCTGIVRDVKSALRINEIEILPYPTDVKTGDDK